MHRQLVPRLTNRFTSFLLSKRRFVLLIAAYYYTSSSESAQFRAAFRDCGTKVMDSVGKALQRSFGALDAFSTQLVAHARETQQDWPFVLFPHFAIRYVFVSAIDG